MGCRDRETVSSVNLLSGLKSGKSATPLGTRGPDDVAGDRADHVYLTDRPWISGAPLQF
jgi:hypothetical protein